MVKFRGFSLEPSASCHLEAEESTHWLLWCVSLLLALLLLQRSSYYGYDCWSSCGSLALFGSCLGWLRVNLFLYKRGVNVFIG